VFLLEDARRIFDQVERVLARVQSRARGETGRIRVRAFRERFPGVVLAPEEGNPPRLVAALKNGHIDVAFVRPSLATSRLLAIAIRWV
jgi:DNA-binding transcriptional LysR family regulator